MIHKYFSHFFVQIIPTIGIKRYYSIARAHIVITICHDKKYKAKCYEDIDIF